MVPIAVRSLLQFNLADIPANAVVSNVNLRLYKTLADSCVAKPFAGSRVTSPWGATTATWANQPPWTDVDRGVVYDPARRATGPSP